MSMAPRLLIFASGTSTGGGSGFEKLVLAARNGILDAHITGVISNHAEGGVRQRAWKLNVPFVHFPKPWDAQRYQQLTAQSGADFFALSGWLKHVVGLDPQTRFNSRRVFNIHPSLLPQFGGDGMYGHHVHEAVIEAFHRREIAQTGLSMHFVTDQYDEGPVFFRCAVKIRDDDTADSIGARVNQQEHIHQARITDLVVHHQITWDGIHPESLRLPPGYSIDCEAEEISPAT